MYHRLSIIPSHDPSFPTKREMFKEADSASDHLADDPQELTPLRSSFYVWKPSPSFKKSSPGSPDFRIAIVNAREENFPVLQQLDELLQSVPYQPPPPGMEKQIYQKLKYGWRNVILAIVDQGVVSYMRLADAGFAKERLYERGRGGGRKRGGRGGRGRGKGRGR